MIVSEKEAIYHIYHTEQEYEWDKFSKTALREKLEYFLEVLYSYNSDRAESERIRLNKKYNFSL